MSLLLLPPDEGLWDILIKDIPKEVTSYTLNLDMLREGVTYDFRVIAVNDYGYGSPSAPSPSISGTCIGHLYDLTMYVHYQSILVVHNNIYLVSFS